MASARNLEMVNNSYFYWRGGLSILFGVIVLVYPKLTVLTLVTLLAIWLLLIGVISIVSGIMSVGRGGWGWIGSILLGILELGVGAYLVQRPGVTTLTIITLLGIVFVVQGFVYFMKTFFEGGATGGHRALSLLLAVLSLAAGIWIWRYPYHGTLAFVWLLGLYAIASGAMLIAMGANRE
jgi:uncharacterized membrane protein HdeD (DUF308 family)